MNGIMVQTIDHRPDKVDHDSLLLSAEELPMYPTVHTNLGESGNNHYIPNCPMVQITNLIVQWSKPETDSLASHVPEYTPFHPIELLGPWYIPHVSVLLMCLVPHSFPLKKPVDPRSYPSKNLVGDQPK